MQVLESHQPTHSGNTLLPRTAWTTLASAQKNEADEVWMKKPIALPTQKKGHGQADGEGEEAMKKNEETCKMHSFPKLLEKWRHFSNCTCKAISTSTQIFSGF